MIILYVSGFSFLIKQMEGDGEIEIEIYLFALLFIHSIVRNESANNTFYRPPLSKTHCRIFLDIRYRISFWREKKEHSITYFT